MTARFRAQFPAGIGVPKAVGGRDFPAVHRGRINYYTGKIITRYRDASLVQHAHTHTGVALDAPLHGGMSNMIYYQEQWEFTVVDAEIGS